MELVDTAVPLLLGLCAVLAGGAGVVMLRRSRHRPDEVLWRGRRVAAPRWYGCGFLFFGLASAALAVRWSVFAARSIGTLLALVVALTFMTAGAVAFIMATRRNGEAARQRSSLP